MRKLWVSLAFIAVLLGNGACSSGQTGSPRCGGAYTCACLSLDGREVFRGHIVSFQEATVEVELEELYSEPSSPVLVPGARGTFRYTVGPIRCTNLREIPALHVEDTVLVALDLDAGELWLVPWSDPLVVGDREIPVDTLSERAARFGCDDDQEQPSCDDTSEWGRCAVGQGRANTTAWWPAVVFVLVASLRRIGVRKRRSP